MTRYGDLDLPEGVMPPPERVARMSAAEQQVRDVLGDDLHDVARSPLGPGWSTDLDVYVRDVDAARTKLLEAGAMPIGQIIAALGHDDETALAVLDGVRWLGRVDLEPGLPKPPVERVIQRARRLGFPDARTVMELRLLSEQGHDLVGDRDHDVLAAAAALERDLGGSALAGLLGGLPDPEEPTRGPARLRRMVLGSIRRPQVRLAVSGVDGSGKSTLIASLEDAFGSCGIPTRVVWTRPGMNLGWIDRVARWYKARKGQETTGIRQLAEGAESGEIASRRGIVGWVWLTLVTVAFISGARARTGRHAGVVIFDRHLLDALGTIDVLYDGVPSGIHRWMIRRFLPPADATVWLDVDPVVASERKPDDLINERLVANQHAAYLRRWQTIPGLRRIEPTTSADMLAVDIIASLDAELAGRRRPFRARMFDAIRKRRG